MVLLYLNSLSTLRTEIGGRLTNEFLQTLIVEQMATDQSNRRLYIVQADLTSWLVGLFMYYEMDSL
jgi:hypothetical protein